MTIATLILCVLLFAERLTGGLLHLALGAALMLLAARHIYVYRHMIKTHRGAALAAELAAAALLLIVIVTGVLMHSLHEVAAVKHLHKMAGVLFAVCTLGHALQHVVQKRK